RAADAAIQLQDAASKSPGSPEIKAWLELAKLAATPASGIGALARLGGDRAPALVRGLVGEGELIAGDTAAAQRAFEGAADGNPMAYRVYTKLAELALTSGKPADADGAARTALGAAPGYLPAHAALGRALVAGGKQSDAGPALQLVVDAGRATGADELAYAEAALAMGQPDAARAALKRAADKGAPDAQVARVSALVDPAAAGAEKVVKPGKRRG